MGSDMTEPNRLKRKLVQSPALGEKEDLPPPSPPQEGQRNRPLKSASSGRPVPSSSPLSSLRQQHPIPIVSKEHGAKVEVKVVF